MRNSHQSPISSPIEVVGEKSSEKTINVSVLHKQVAEVTIANNPKIDHRLLAEYERLISASKDVVSVKKQGADYNLSHPLSSKDKPTDAYHRGQTVIANKTK